MKEIKEEQKRKAEAFKEKIRKKIEERNKDKVDGVPKGYFKPEVIYDEVYFQGLKWLNSL